MPEFVIARRATGEQISVTLDTGFLAGAFGGSGSGKSEFLKRFLLGAFQTYRERLQAIIVDPKRVGFEIGDWNLRAYVYSDPIQYIQILTSVLNEVDRRYLWIREQRAKGARVKGVTPSGETPFLLLVIDELPMFVGHASLTASQQKEVLNLLVALYQRARQAAVGILVSSQTASTSVIPNAIRVCMDQRFIFHLASEEENKMASVNCEKVKAHMLYLPGDGYFLTSLTRGEYDQGRVYMVTEDEEERLLTSIAEDKRYLYCLDWDNPEFAG